MKLTPVHSSRIAALGYDEDAFTCYIQFRPKHGATAGPVYAYRNVSPELFDDFRNAPSLGAFFREHLAGNPDHPYSRMSPGDGEREAATAADASAPVTGDAPAFATPERAIETAHALAQEARALAITTPEAYRRAGEEIVRIARERKRRLDFFRPMKEAAYAAHRAICAKENEALAPLQFAEQVLHRGLVEYREREEKQRRSRQLSLDAENLRIAQQEAARRAADLAEQYALALEMEGETELAAQARQELAAGSRHAAPACSARKRRAAGRGPQLFPRLEFPHRGSRGRSALPRVVLDR